MNWADRIVEECWPHIDQVSREQIADAMRRAKGAGLKEVSAGLHTLAPIVLPSTALLLDLLAKNFTERAAAIENGKD